MPSLAIGDRYIGDEYPCFIIAEIGQNHQGSMKRAKELIRKAKVSLVKMIVNLIDLLFT